MWCKLSHHPSWMYCYVMQTLTPPFMNVLLCNVRSHWVKVIRNSEDCFPTSFDYSLTTRNIITKYVYIILYIYIIYMAPSQNCVWNVPRCSGRMERRGFVTGLVPDLWSVMKYRLYINKCMYVYIYIYGCESKIGYGSLRGDPYYGSRVLT